LFKTISFERDKVALCDFLDIDFLLDDAPRYAQDAKDYNANVKVLVPSRPWNQELEHTRADDAYKIITGTALDKKSYYSSTAEQLEILKKKDQYTKK